MSFEMDNYSVTDDEDELNLHPPKDKEEEKELEKWKLTKLNVRSIIS